MPLQNLVKMVWNMCCRDPLAGCSIDIRGYKHWIIATNRRTPLVLSITSKSMRMPPFEWRPDLDLGTRAGLIALSQLLVDRL